MSAKAMAKVVVVGLLLVSGAAVGAMTNSGTRGSAQVHAQGAPPPGTSEIIICPDVWLYQPFAAIAPSLSEAMAHPDRVYGWNRLPRPWLPFQPAFNTPNRALTLANGARPFHPIYNTLQFKGGCGGRGWCPPATL